MSSNGVGKIESCDSSGSRVIILQATIWGAEKMLIITLIIVKKNILKEDWKNSLKSFFHIFSQFQCYESIIALLYSAI